MKKIILTLLLVLCLQSVSALLVSVNDYDPTPAEAGEIVTVWLRVDNIGEDPTNIEYFLEIQPRDGLRLAPGEAAKKRIGSLGGSNYRVIEYRLQVNEDALEGQNLIKASVSANGIATITQDIFITVKEKDRKEATLEIGDIDSDPLKIKPDDDVKLDITLINIGEADAKGIRAQLTRLPQGVTPATSYDDLILLGTIAQDGQGEATFYLDIDENVAAGRYEAMLMLDYKYKPLDNDDDYVFETKQLPVLLDIKPTPLFSIEEVVFNVDQVKAGDTAVQMTLTITNIGEEKAEYVRVKAFSKTEQPFSFDVSSDFVAPYLEAGESAQATLEFDVDEDADVQEYLLELEIKHIMDNDVITQQKKIPIDVASASDQGFNWLIIIIIIVLGAAILFALRKNKSKK